MFASEEELREAVERLARGEITEADLTSFCRSVALYRMDAIMAACDSAGVEPEEFVDQVDALVEEMKAHIRAKTMRVEIVADGEGFRLVTGATH